MHAVAHPVRFCVVAHLDDVALQRVQIQHKARRLDLCRIHARQRRHVIAHFEAVEFNRCIHGVGSFNWTTARRQDRRCPGDDDPDPLAREPVLVGKDGGQRHGAAGFHHDFHTLPRQLHRAHDLIFRGCQDIADVV